MLHADQLPGTRVRVVVLAGCGVGSGSNCPCVCLPFFLFDFSCRLSWVILTPRFARLVIAMCGACVRVGGRDQGHPILHGSRECGGGGRGLVQDLDPTIRANRLARVGFAVVVLCESGERCVGGDPWVFRGDGDVVVGGGRKKHVFFSISLRSIRCTSRVNASWTWVASGTIC
jgi:hypothetical protein